MNATVVSYANIIAGNYNDTDLTTIPNAYSIKALYNAIQNIDVTSQLGNYLLKSDAADTYQPKGNYLTTHQTIYGLTIQKNSTDVGTYNPKSKAVTIDIAVPTKVSELTNDSGYTDNTGTVTSVGISVPTGLSVTNSPITTKGTIAITFAEGYSIPTIAKQTSWNNISTLESYFNNGSAKKALQLTNARKLWGNSFNGTADIDGSIIIPGKNYISIGDVKLIYDATNKALKIDGNLYATGGISAYGASSVSGGGGLNASVISYASILEGSYVDTDLTSIPNAYSVKALSNRIDNIATELGDLNLSWNNITGKPTTFTPSAHKHKWIDITDRITKVSQLTNDAGYLTTHQSLSSYYTKAEIDAKGYTTNKGTVTSIGLTLPTGLTCATKSITTSGIFAVSFASGYSIPTTTKQSSWDSAVSVKHSHSNKSVLDGISSAKVTHWDSAYNWYSLMTTDEETADGIINKWNEVVNFLANIAQTDTLSGIINGINTSISNEVSRAKKAEGTNASNISANKTSITTLQGYFTSGSAKKALQLTNTRKLWGNSFNGTADVNGSIVLPNGKYISIGNIKLEYDATNKALKITNTTTDEVANLYASGGVSAYGVGSVAGSGGSLNGSVLSYDLAIKLTSAGDNELSQLASAWSIAKLNSRISSLEGGSALDVVTSGTGNAVTGISKNGTTINVTKGTSFLTSHQSLANYLTKTDASNTYLTKSAASSTYQPKGNYLTAHQSLDGYINNIVTSGAGNAITSVTKSGKTVTFTKGSTFLTSHQKLDHLISVDNRNLDISPTMYNRGIYPMFISNTTDHLNDGGRYHGILHWRSYGDGSDLTGGYPIQIAYTANGRLWTRIAKSNTTWDNWVKMNAGYADLAGSVDWNNITGKPSSFTPSSHTHDGRYVRAFGTSNDNIDSDLGQSFKTFDPIPSGTPPEQSPNISLLSIGENFNRRKQLAFIYSSDNIYYRRRINGEFTSWKRIALASEIPNKNSWNYDGRYVRAFGTSNDNIDSDLGQSFKTFDPIPSGTPPEQSPNISLLSIGENFNRRKQLAFIYSSDNIYYRRRINGEFTSWKRIALASEIPNKNSWNYDGRYLRLSGDDTMVGAIKSNFSAGTWINGCTNAIIVATYKGYNSLIAAPIRSGNVCISTWTAEDNLNFGYAKTGKTNNSFDKKMYWNAPNNNLHADYFTGHLSGTADNADTVDGYHANGLLTALSNSNKGISITVGGTTKSVSNISVNYASSAGNADTVDGYHESSFLRYRGSYDDASVTKDGVGVYGWAHTNNGHNNFHESWGDIINIQGYSTWRTRFDIGVSGRIRIMHGINTTKATEVGYLAYLHDNVASANKLKTPRTIWGQSFDGTNNVSGALSGATTISASNTISTSLQNGALKIGNKSAPISAIDAQIIFNTGAALRFGESNWDWNTWAGLKYVHSSKTIYLGIADGSTFNANSAQSGGTLQLPAISNVILNNNAGLYGKNTSGTAIEMIKSTTWNSIDVGRGAMYNKLDLEILGRNIYFIASSDGGTTTKQLQFTTSKIYTHITIETEGNLLAHGGVTAYSSSDIRLKQNLCKLNYLNIIKAMGGSYGFTWRKDNKHSIGWIAQHVLNNPYMNDIVETDENGYYKINYWSPKLIATAFGAIEQVDDEVSKLKARVTYLESEVERLTNDNKLLMNK